MLDTGSRIAAKRKPRALRSSGAEGVLVLLLGLGGCGVPPGTELLPLTVPERRPPQPDRTLDVDDWGAALGARVSLEENGVALEWALDPDGWSELERGVLRRPHPLPIQFRGIPSARAELRSGERVYPEIRELERRAEARGCYYSTKETLFFRPVEPGRRPELHYSLLLPRELPLGDGRARFSTGSVAGAGVLVLPGESWSRDLQLSPGRSLRFFTTVRGASADPGDRVRFEVRVAGELLWSQERGLDPEEDAWHELDLGEAPKSGLQEVSFSVHGTPAWTAFVGPAVGPTEPRPPRRPDLVLFLADTFRADNLELGGGAPELAPALNRLARQGLAFENAWSTSCWTLPSQGSMFTGLLPPDHGAQLQSQVLPRDVPTLTDVLREAGYRTGAITDGGFVSSRFHFDQGFEWYVEQPNLESWSLERTLELASEFLRVRDGRPTFLFVQTYRTHYPYRVGPEESRAEADRFLHSVGEDPNPGMGVGERSEEAIRGLLPFYLAAVSDLDARVGAWWGEVRALRPPEEPPYLLFTSDHGEAFYEHENFDHRGWMWNELLRVPLFLLGPGIEPRRESRAASLLDVPRTLAHLAGVPSPSSWQGENLIELEEERRLLGFYRDASRYDYAAIEARHKILGTMDEAGVPSYAFELGSDPGEHDNLAETAGWPRELAREVVPFAERSRASSQAVELAPEVIENLRAIGYGGD